MGFSVSGSAAIIFAGMLIAFGTWYTASSNSFERVSEAQTDRADAALDQKNTAIDITRTSTSGDLVVEVTNTGSTSLSLDETDLLVDNEHRSGWQAGADVDGDPDTDLWLPGETVAITVTASSPTRVKVVTESGVSDTEVL